MPNLEALHGSGAHSQQPDTSIQRTAHASSRRMLLQPLWKVQPLPWKLGNKHHVLTTTCRRHWLKEKSESKRTFNTLNIRSWKSIWCKIAQQSFNSSHNKTVKHWLKTPKVSKSIQKYPKVSKSIQKYPKVSEFANHSVPEHIGRASSRLGLASEHELSLSSQDQLEIILIILMPNLEALHGSGAHSQQPDTSIQRTAHASSRRMLLQPLWKVQPLPWKLGNKHHVLTTTCRRHWLKEKSESKRTFNTLNIRSWKSIWCRIAQQSFKSSHNKTVKHWLKTPKVSKSIQKYPKVSEFANHSVPEHIGGASSRPGLASEHELSLSSQDQLEIILIILMPNLEALHGSGAHSQQPDTSIQRTAHASSRRMLLQPLWKVQPLPWKLGNKHHVLTTTCRRHWLKEKSESKRTFNTLNIRSWKSIWCKIAQQSFNSSHNKTVKHWLKTPKVSKSIQKYPKVSKSIQKCQSLPITVSPNTLAEPPPDRVWHRSTSYPWAVKISWRSFWSFWCQTWKLCMVVVLIHNSQTPQYKERLTPLLVGCFFSLFGRYSLFHGSLETNIMFWQRHAERHWLKEKSE